MLPKRVIWALYFGRRLGSKSVLLKDTLRHIFKYEFI